MTQFTDLALDPAVLKAVADAGYTTPTPIQAQAIPPALEGRDVLGIAQTGTGKTASFTLPLITLLKKGRARARMPRSLVLAPTRELAAQVAENFDIYAKHTKLTKALLIGGVSFGEQDKLIDRGVDVLIATPGRLLDHFERGKLLLTGVQIMVVDEADRMLDMGFIPDIERIFSLTPFTRQTFFYSATMAPEIERITNTFLSAPARVEVARQATASETIEQQLIEVTAARRDVAFKMKRAVLREVIRAEGERLKNAIIFCNRKVDVDVLAKSLKKHGFDAAPIHGDLDQSVRTRTLESFRDGTLKLLIASDVAARGLDIPAVSHVFNFDVPSHAEDYVHRIGRTGRAGREGKAVTLSAPADDKYLAAIESLIQKPIPRGALPEVDLDMSPDAPAPRRARRSEGDKRSRKPVRDESLPPASTVPIDAAPMDAGPIDAGPIDAGPVAAELAPVAPAGVDAPAPAESAPASRSSAAPQRRGGGREERRDDRRDDRREERRDDRRGRGRGDAVVVGMGDHVPDFLMRSFGTGASAPAGD